VTEIKHHTIMTIYIIVENVQYQNETERFNLEAHQTEESAKKAIANYSSETVTRSNEFRVWYTFQPCKLF
jgi:stalled ribosome rescue protein Dom34